MSSKPTYVKAQDGLRALQVKLHTGEKLHYISRYINQFCTGTRTKWNVRNYIDLFSGPGINVYDVDGEEAKSASFEALTHKFPFTSYFVNDIDPESIDALRTRTESLRLGTAVQVRFTCSDCNQAVDSIVQSISRTSSVNLAVIDGFGIECHWNTVKKLASVPRMDWVILFPGNMTVVRNAERWSQEDDAQLDLFMPNKSWRQVWSDKRLAGGKAAADLLRLYIDGLRYLNYQSEGSIHPQLIKSENGTPLYHLIFASRSPLGEKFWRQATNRDDAGQTSLPF